MTAQQMSHFGRRGPKPIIFVLNNSGYLIERMLCKESRKLVQNLAQWHYGELPKALGCDDWFTARVTTCRQIDHALKTASSCQP